MTNFNSNGFGAAMGNNPGIFAVPGDTISQTMQAPSAGRVRLRHINLATICQGGTQPDPSYCNLYVVVGGNSSDPPLKASFPTAAELANSGYVCKFATVVRMYKFEGGDFYFGEEEIVATAGQKIVVVTSTLIDNSAGLKTAVNSFIYLSCLGDDSFATIAAKLR